MTSKTHRLYQGFVFDKEDPFKSEVIKDDHYLAYFRPERKTMYKRGMNDTLGPVFEHPVNFIQFY